MTDPGISKKKQSMCRDAGFVPTFLKKLIKLRKLGPKGLTKSAPFLLDPPMKNAQSFFSLRVISKVNS